MTGELQTAVIVVAAVLLGIGCTLLVQWIGAVRRLAREVTDTSQQIGRLASSLQPVADRLARLSAAAEESEPDLRRLQRTLGTFSESSEQMSEQLARVSSWLGVAVPLIIAAVDRWQAAGQTDAAQEGQAPRGPAEGMTERAPSHTSRAGPVQANGGG